ncbi:MAG: CBS domain-containing protein [Elusimicrobia bacterium]|nr:CBS domain-containing protein [Elusimicrobiota bacterium]
MDILQVITDRISHLHLNILFLIGLALFGGTIGGRIFQKLKVPQVVGYMLIGIGIGLSGLKIVDQHVISVMEPFNFFALGLIGFMIGGELKKEVFVKYGNQITILLLFEGLTAFVCVTLCIGLIGSLFYESTRSVWAMALVLGAIGSATAPASTTDILWEYKTKGPLTTTLLGVVALDDGLALFLFAIAASFAMRLIGNGHAGFLGSILQPMYEIVGALVVGILSGMFLTKIFRFYHESEKILAFSIGAVLLVLGTSLILHIDMLLAAMTMGAVVVNFAPIVSKDVFNLVKGFSPPIYVLFFVLVGASLDIKITNKIIILLVLLYMIGVTVGKISGAYMGARLSNLPKKVQKYLPLCLYSQAGVAVGLSMIAYHMFPRQEGNTIIVIITITTFIIQIFGPPLTKYAISQAGEVGLNITEEDLIKKTYVKDLMDKNPPVIHENLPLSSVLKIFAADNNLYYPVVDHHDKLVGVISVDSIKQTFMETDMGSFLLAYDLMEPVVATVTETAYVSEAKDLFNRYNLEYLPVVTGDNTIVGLIEERTLNKLISTKMIELQKKAEQLG